MRCNIKPPTKSNQRKALVSFSSIIHVVFLKYSLLLLTLDYSTISPSFGPVSIPLFCKFYTYIHKYINTYSDPVIVQVVYVPSGPLWHSSSFNLVLSNPIYKTTLLQSVSCINIQFSINVYYLYLISLSSCLIFSIQLQN